MNEQFDPYFKWLGIPPNEQPPDHYRLLSIPRFVDDPDVIANAADRQMMMIRTFQTGERAAMSQKLLNELAQAKVCLLNRQSKTAYDTSLQMSPLLDEIKLEPPLSRHPPVKETKQSWSGPSSDQRSARRSIRPVENEITLPSPDFLPLDKQRWARPGPPPNRLRPLKRRSPTWNRIWPIWLATAGVLALVVILAWVIKNKQPPQTPANQTASNQSRPNGSGNNTSWQGKTTTQEIANNQPRPDRPSKAIPLSNSFGGFGTPSPQPGSFGERTNQADTALEGQASHQQVTDIVRDGVTVTEARTPSPHPPMALDAEVQVWKASSDKALSDKATPPSDFKSIAEQGAPLIQRAIDEKSKALAEICVDESLAAARRSNSDELLRKITLLVVQVNHMQRQ